MRLIDGDELKTAFPCGETVRTECVRATIDHMPTVEAVPVEHGRWIENEGFDGDCYYTCSVCQCDWTMIEGTPAENNMRYCPECGAKMDLEGK